MYEIYEIKIAKILIADTGFYVQKVEDLHPQMFALADEVKIRELCDLGEAAEVKYGMKYGGATTTFFCPPAIWQRWLKNKESAPCDNGVGRTHHSWMRVS